MGEQMFKGSSEAYQLTLYSAGASPAIEAAAERIRQWCAERAIPLRFFIIDVLAQPEHAMQERVFATPTLVREAPPPQRRVIGELGKTATIMRLLQMPGAD